MVTKNLKTPDKVEKSNVSDPTCSNIRFASAFTGQDLVSLIRESRKSSVLNNPVSHLPTPDQAQGVSPREIKTECSILH